MPFDNVNNPIEPVKLSEMEYDEPTRDELRRTFNQIISFADAMSQRAKSSEELAEQLAEDVSNLLGDYVRRKPSKDFHNRVQPKYPGILSLAFRAHSAQTADFFNLESSTGTELGHMDVNGAVWLPRGWAFGTSPSTMAPAAGLGYLSTNSGTDPEIFLEVEGTGIGSIGIDVNGEHFVDRDTGVPEIEFRAAGTTAGEIGVNSGVHFLNRPSGEPQWEFRAGDSALGSIGLAATSEHWINRAAGVPEIEFRVAGTTVGEVGVNSGVHFLNRPSGEPQWEFRAGDSALGQIGLAATSEHWINRASGAAEIEFRSGGTTAGEVGVNAGVHFLNRPSGEPQWEFRAGDSALGSIGLAATSEHWINRAAGDPEIEFRVAGTTTGEYGVASNIHFLNRPSGEPTLEFRSGDSALGQIGVAATFEHWINRASGSPNLEFRSGGTNLVDLGANSSYEFTLNIATANVLYTPTLNFSKDDSVLSDIQIDYSLGNFYYRKQAATDISFFAVNNVATAAATIGWLSFVSSDSELVYAAATGRTPSLALYSNAIRMCSIASDTQDILNFLDAAETGNIIQFDLTDGAIGWGDYTVTSISPDGTGGVKLVLGGLDYYEFTQTHALFAREIRAPFGSLGSPSFTFDTDDDTGLRRSAANIATIDAGGSAVANFDLNTASPRLDVVGSGGLHIGGTQVIDSGRIADFVSLDIGGSEVISSGRIADFVSLNIGGTEVVDSSRNINATSYEISGTTVVTSGRVGQNFLQMNVDSLRLDSTTLSNQGNSAYPSINLATNTLDFESDTATGLTRFFRGKTYTSGPSFIIHRGNNSSNVSFQVAASTALATFNSWNNSSGGIVALGRIEFGGASSTKYYNCGMGVIEANVATVGSRSLSTSLNYWRCTTGTSGYIPIDLGTLGLGSTIKAIKVTGYFTYGSVASGSWQLRLYNNGATGGQTLIADSTSTSLVSTGAKTLTATHSTRYTSVTAQSLSAILDVTVGSSNTLDVIAIELLYEQRQC